MINVIIENMTFFDLPTDILKLIAIHLLNENILTTPYLINQDAVNIAQVSKPGNTYYKTTLLPILHQKYKKPSMDHLSLQNLNDILKSFGIASLKTKTLATRALADLNQYHASIVINKWNKVPKTIAMKEYKLTDKDLTNIPYESLRNPHYSSRNEMMLYPRYLLALASSRKWGTVENLMGKKIKQQQASEKRKNTIKNNKNNRIKVLTDALEKRGLSLRSDSRLCSQYILNGGSLSLEKVVDTMEEMNFYYNHTRYKEIYGNIIQKMLEYKGRFDKDEVSEDAKSEALDLFLKNNDNYDKLLPVSLMRKLSKNSQMEVSDFCKCSDPLVNWQRFGEHLQ